MSKELESQYWQTIRKAVHAVDRQSRPQGPVMDDGAVLDMVLDLLLVHASNASQARVEAAISDDFGSNPDSLTPASLHQVHMAARTSDSSRISMMQQPFWEAYQKDPSFKTFADWFRLVPPFSPDPPMFCWGESEGRLTINNCLRGSTGKIPEDPLECPVCEAQRCPFEDIENYVRLP